MISVHDKTGLETLGRGLTEAGVEVISTGGTARRLSDAGVEVIPVSDVTQFPEMLGGRVKTLHPKIHGGILFRRDDPEHVRQAEEAGIGPIDLVVVNLYPFEATVARDGVTRAEAVEEIDIGGPGMIRAAAKNHAHVAVIVDPADYETLLNELTSSGGIDEATAARWATKAYARTAAYDAAISAWLAGQDSPDDVAPVAVVAGRGHASLRYGENPHQVAAAFTVTGEPGGVLQAECLQGKELSYNNICDLDAAWTLARDLEGSGVAIIKHANPCGAAEADTPLAALEAARACDPVSAFGGIFAFNCPVDAQAAASMLEGFVECVIAPSYADDALALFAKKKNVRVLAGELPPRPRPGREWRRVTGGFLVQDWDDVASSRDELRTVTERAPTDDELEALAFAWRVAKHVKSNAILFAGPGRTLGVGAGQMSRVDAAEIAVAKAKKNDLSLAGSVVASDAFFPFRDGVDVLHEAGATAVIQPGGSKRDDEVIGACNEHGMAMVFTGRRHFRH